MARECRLVGKKYIIQENSWFQYNSLYNLFTMNLYPKDFNKKQSQFVQFNAFYKKMQRLM